MENARSTLNKTEEIIATSGVTVSQAFAIQSRKDVPMKRLKVKTTQHKAAAAAQHPLVFHTHTKTATMKMTPSR